MKFMAAISPDGYMCRGPEDTMAWTPKIDKQIFQIISSLNGGICLVSKKTLLNMPRFLEGRTLIPISRKNFNLAQAYEKFPNALIIGGPTLLKAANHFALIDELIINQIHEVSPISQKVPDEYRFPLDILTSYNKVIDIEFFEMQTSIYRLKR